MSTVTYPAIVEGRTGVGYSAFFPDLPGCVTAADNQIELLAAAREALALHIAGMIEDGDALPEATPVEALESDPEVDEVARILVDAEIEDAPVRVNVSFSTAFLRRIDVAAESRGMTRSGFLADGARRLLTASAAQAGQASIRRAVEEVNGLAGASGETVVVSTHIYELNEPGVASFSRDDKAREIKHAGPSRPRRR